MKTADVHERLEELLPCEEIPDNTKELIPVKNNVKKWATQNAYLLIFLMIMFGIGWVVTIVTN